MRLRLLSRGYCHLCHEMEAALRPLVEEFGASLEIVDVDEVPDLLARYDEDVPVLLDGETELCRHRLDPAAVRAHLGGFL